MELENVLIPIQSKRPEIEVTGRPPEGKKKKKRVSFSEKPQLKRETMPFSIVQDIMHVKSNITVAQLLNIPQYRKELKKALTPKRSRPAKKKNTGKQKESMASISTTHTPMICKGIVNQWVIEAIIDSGSSVSIISKSFAERLGRSPNKRSL
jgi:predicted aspartyl protease